MKGGAASRSWPIRWWWLLLRPRHTIWPTRDGWWCLFAAMGLGLAAVNTGNNLVYLLCSMLLALIVVSGVLSEQSMRGLSLVAVRPEEVYAGRPALVGAALRNRKRWLPSCSVTLEVLGRPGRFLHVPWLEAGAERLCTWEVVLPSRGRHRLPGVRLTTRFPFGLFLKAGRPKLDEVVLVYPAVGPVPWEIRSRLGEAGEAAARRRGRGPDLYDLRAYRPGDDPRLIHWRSSAKTRSLVVRELEDDTALDARLILTGTGARSRERLEQALSEAASVAVHLLNAGAGVELVGPLTAVPFGRGRGHARALLGALALYEPPRGAESPLEPAGPPRQGVREIPISLD
jgi:uncharacterized protein (DUF58 family)